MIEGFETAPYFLKLGEVNLCKCGYEGALPELIANATSDKNPNGYPEVHFSTTFKVRQDKTIQSLNKNHKSLVDDVKCNLNGYSLEDVVSTISENAEGWEHDIYTDSYGSKLRAVPIKEVYDAMLMSQAEHTIRNGGEYRRYTMALALLKTTMEGFNTDGESDVSVVLWGY